jgi:putative transposase
VAFLALRRALQHGAGAAHDRLAALPHGQVCLTRYQQEAELKAIRAEMPEYAAIHSHVLHDVLARPDTTYHAFFRRVANGEQTGFPRFQGRSHSRDARPALMLG